MQTNYMFCIVCYENCHRNGLCGDFRHTICQDCEDKLHNPSCPMCKIYIPQDERLTGYLSAQYENDSETESESTYSFSKSVKIMKPNSKWTQQLQLEWLRLRFLSMDDELMDFL